MYAEITIPGRPITKKNHQKIVYRKGRPLIIQSDFYQAYETECLYRLKQYLGPRFESQIWVKVLYWMPNRRSWPDLLGLLQATADILEKARIIKNDRDVYSFDGSRIVGVDKDNPRAEIKIEEVSENGTK